MREPQQEAGTDSIRGHSGQEIPDQEPDSWIQDQLPDLLAARPWRRLASPSLGFPACKSGQNSTRSVDATTDPGGCSNAGSATKARACSPPARGGLLPSHEPVQQCVSGGFHQTQNALNSRTPQLRPQGTTEEKHV